MNEAFELLYIKPSCTASVWIKLLVLFPPGVLRPRWKTQLKITCLMWIMGNHSCWATETWHREVHCTVTNQTWIHPPSPLKTQHNPTTTSPTLYGPTARWLMRWVQYMAAILSSASLLFFARDFLIMRDWFFTIEISTIVKLDHLFSILQNALSSAGCGNLDCALYKEKICSTLT